MSQLRKVAEQCVHKALSGVEKLGGIYGVVLYMADDMSSAGVALGVTPYLEKQLAKEHAKNVSDPELIIPDYCFEACASMWNELDYGRTALRPLNTLLGSTSKKPRGRRTIERGLTGALQKMRDDGSFSGAAFSDDVLLGIQFSEPSDVGLVLRVSKELNSKKWHERVELYCEYELKYYE